HSSGPDGALRGVVFLGAYRQRGGAQRHPVEALGELEERRVAAVADGSHDLGHAARDLRIHRAGRALPRADDPGHALGRCLEQPNHSRVRSARPDTACRMAVMSWLTWEWAVLSDARLTISRAVEVRISATSTSPLARSVSPDCTRSTMRSATPTRGASSMEPCSLTSHPTPSPTPTRAASPMEPSSLTISTWIPRSEK